MYTLAHFSVYTHGDTHNHSDHQAEFRQKDLINPLKFGFKFQVFSTVCAQCAVNDTETRIMQYKMKAQKKAVGRFA